MSEESFPKSGGKLISKSKLSSFVGPYPNSFPLILAYPYGYPPTTIPPINGTYEAVAVEGFFEIKSVPFPL